MNNVPHGILNDQLASIRNNVIRMLKRLLRISPVILGGLILYSPIIFQYQVIEWDSFEYLFPRLLFLVDHFRQLTFPFWNPYYLAGSPIFSEVSAFGYSIFAVLLSLLPGDTNLFYAFELLLILLGIVGAIGMQQLMLVFRIEYAIATTFAIVSYLMIGPLLGQAALLWSIVSLPWLLIGIEKLLDANSTRIDSASLIFFILGIAFIQLQAYYGTQIYNAIFILIYMVLRIFCFPANNRKMLFIKSTKLVLIVVPCVIGLCLIYLLPAIENRLFFYSDFHGDLFSPDDYLRGFTPDSATVSSLHLWQTTSKDVVTPFAFYDSNNHQGIVSVFGSTPLILLIGLCGLTANYRNFRILKFAALAAIFFSYVMGSGNFVYDFFSLIPVVRNVRYPVTAMYLVQLPLVIMAASTLDLFFKGPIKISRTRNALLMLIFISFAGYLIYLYLNIHVYYFVLAFLMCAFVYCLIYKKRTLACCIILLELSCYHIGSGVYSGSTDFIFLRNHGELERNSISQREREVTIYNQFKRRMLKRESLIITDHVWLMNRVPINHGYSPSDSPLYWYIKNMPWIEDMAGIATSTREVNGNEHYQDESDNQWLERLAAQLNTLENGQVLVDEKIRINDQTSRIQSFVIQPNKFSLVVESHSDTIAYVTDKYYPGWHVLVDGIEQPILIVNLLFKGVRITPGMHLIEFIFKPETFYIGSAISGSVLSLLLIVLILSKRKKILKFKATPEM